MMITELNLPIAAPRTLQHEPDTRDAARSFRVGRNLVNIFRRHEASGTRVAKMPYIGRVVTNIDAGVTLPKSGIKSFEDVRAKQYTVGASGGGSTTVLFPTALTSYAGAKFKLVRGYSGTTDILLAMERGEVDIVGAYGPWHVGEPSRLGTPR
jgi:hypothetical protein